MALSESGLTTGTMLCPALLVWKERTIVSLWAKRASRGIVSPNKMLGIAVRQMPVTVRMSDGASGFGSKVSNWLGPPCWKRSHHGPPGEVVGFPARAGLEKRQR